MPRATRSIEQWGRSCSSSGVVVGKGGDKRKIEREEEVKVRRRSRRRRTKWKWKIEKGATMSTT